jgi:hypothetical protein
MKKCNLRKLYEVEVKEQYHVNISKKFENLGNLDDDDDDDDVEINRA